MSHLTHSTHEEWGLPHVEPNYIFHIWTAVSRIITISSIMPGRFFNFTLLSNSWLSLGKRWHIVQHIVVQYVLHSHYHLINPMKLLYNTFYESLDNKIREWRERWTYRWINQCFLKDASWNIPVLLYVSAHLLEILYILAGLLRKHVILSPLFWQILLTFSQNVT